MNLLAFLRPDCTYKASDLAPIGNVILDPVVLAVGINSPFNTLKDFIDYAKTNPGKIILGVDGPQTSAQLQALIMQDAIGLDLKYAFYNGAAPALTAAIGGHTFGTTPGASEAVPYVQNKQLKVLTVFSDVRYQDLPDVPTFKEATGLDASYVPSYRGFGVPSKVSDEIRLKLQAALQDVVEDPAFIAKAKEIGLPLRFETADEFANDMATLEKELQKYKDVMTPKE
jgi:tripartite-type tricarboxylate transporter receptor subunit TctC